jgi:hypothetical protein
MMDRRQPPMCVDCSIVDMYNVSKFFTALFVCLFYSRLMSIHSEEVCGL